MTDAPRRLVFGQHIYCPHCEGKGIYSFNGNVVERPCRRCGGSGVEDLRAEAEGSEYQPAPHKQRDRSVDL